MIAQTEVFSWILFYTEASIKSSHCPRDNCHLPLMNSKVLRFQGTTATTLFPFCGRLHRLHRLPIEFTVKKDVNCDGD